MDWCYSRRSEGGEWVVCGEEKEKVEEVLRKAERMKAEETERTKRRDEKG